MTMSRIFPENAALPVCIGRLEFESQPLNIACAPFPNGRLAVYLRSGLAMYCRWAVNLPDLPIADDEFFAKTYDENEPLREPMLATGLFEDTGQRAVGGFVELELWRLSAAGRQALAAQA